MTTNQNSVNAPFLLPRFLGKPTLMEQQQIMLPSHGIIQLRELDDLDDAIVQETNAEWERLGQDLQVLKEEFGDVAKFTVIQGESIDIIEKNTTCATHNAEEGVVELRKAETLSKCCGCCPFC